MPITHSTVVVVADDGTSPVGSDEWNAAHSIPDHSELGSIGTDDHHAKQHALNDAAHHTGTLDDSQIPSTIARDTEVTAAIAAHAVESDPHTGYRLESENHSHASSGAQGGTISHTTLTDLTTGDPHTQYRLESADHTHEATGAQGGKLDHGAALNGLSDDDHPQYSLWSAIQASQLVNEVMNFPSLESADDTQPEWWEEADANATLTEVDIAGESITEDYERGLKVVVATANSYAYQRYTYADQPRVKSGRKLSAIFAVWSVSSVNARIRLITSAATAVVSSTTTTAGWTILTAENITLDGTYVDIRLEVDVGTAYFVPLGINIGARAVPLRSRGLRYRHRDPVLTLDLAGSADPNTWTDEDVTADTSNIAVMAVCHMRVRETDASTTYIFDTRRNGSSKALATNEALAVVQVSMTELRAFWTQLLDDQQIFEYILDRIAGSNALDVGSLYIDAWWEWE